MLTASLAVSAADYIVDGQYVTIPVWNVENGGASVVRLQIVGDNIIRVQATPASQLPEKKSLIVVKQTARPHFVVTDGDELCVKTSRLEARVVKKTGAVTFWDADGTLLLRQ